MEIKKKSLSILQKIQIILEILKGIDFLHSKNIIHLDLKSENILLDENLKVKICDFGISKIKQTNETQSFTLNTKGTLFYMAPESFDGNYSYYSDIYSLGIILYEILYECEPYDKKMNLKKHLNFK